jgi:hypothetical protein
MQENESLPGLKLETVQLNTEQREARHDFIKRGLLARDEARTTGQYVSSDEMLLRLDDALARALLLVRRV